MCTDGTLPATVNAPPAITSPPGSVASARTSGSTGLAMPEPTGDQLVPFHRAMHSNPAPEMVVKLPPASTSPFGSVHSARATVFASGPVTDPSCDQLEPFHCATKPRPPATMSPFGSAASAHVPMPGTPLNTAQDEPFQRATPAPVPAWPPATRSPFAATVSAYGCENGRSPSPLQLA